MLSTLPKLMFFCNFVSRASTCNIFSLQDVKSAFCDVWYQDDPNDQHLSICSSLWAMMPAMTCPTIKIDPVVGTSILLTQLFRSLLGREKNLYYTILYYTILYYTILYYTILYYTILYYTIQIYADYTVSLSFRPRQASLYDNKPLSLILFSKGHLLFIHKTRKTICTKFFKSLFGQQKLSEDPKKALI